MSPRSRGDPRRAPTTRPVPTKGAPLTRSTRHPAMRALALLAILMLVAFAAACGSDDETSDDPAADTDTAAMTTTTDTAPEVPAAPTVVEIPAAEEGLAFAVTEATAPAGTITLSMPNPSTMPHNIAMRDPVEAEGEIVNQGGVSEITVELEPGVYEYYCSVPGHEAGGMVGTLTVE